MDENEMNVNVASDDRDYEQEIIELLHSGLPDSEIAEKLSDYHDHDIAGAIEELERDEIKHVFERLGEERFSEILAYVEDSH